MMYRPVEDINKSSLYRRYPEKLDVDKFKDHKSRERDIYVCT